jgi:small subunit ribosomal protein S15
LTLLKEEKQEIIEKFKMHESDTGSSAVQVAIMTSRINSLNEHLKNNKMDHHTRRGLVMLVGKRKRLLDYIKDNDLEGYRKLIKDLGLRK